VSSSTDVEQQVAMYKQRIAQAQHGQAQAQHAYEVADRQAVDAVQALREFGINSLEEAEAKIAELVAEQDKEMAAVEAALAPKEAM
jgi:uncharacterized protein (DUF1810 family)